MKKTGKIINVLFLILGIAMIAYYLALGIIVRFGQSLQFLWLAGGIVCIARYFYWLYVDHSGKFPPRKPTIILRSILALCLAFFLIAEIWILGNGLMAPQPNLDAIIVLGAKVNGQEPSGALRNRIQVGVEYLQANPQTIAVLSGGQGPDEDISEAQCMYENMVAKGIDPARLIPEERSTDTSENLLFSRELLPEDVESIGLVTNNFHICRSLALARRLGWENVHGVPVATTLLSMPHYLMREFIGILYDGLRGNLAF